jgi:hypothetical protein
MDTALEQIDAQFVVSARLADDIRAPRHVSLPLTFDNYFGVYRSKKVMNSPPAAHTAPLPSDNRTYTTSPQTLCDAVVPARIAESREVPFWVQLPRQGGHWASCRAEAVESSAIRLIVRQANGDRLLRVNHAASRRRAAASKGQAWTWRARRTISSSNPSPVSS